MQTSQSYIFCILQHFVTKFCNYTDFNKFFTGIYFFWPKSKISLTCKLSIVLTSPSKNAREVVNPTPVNPFDHTAIFLKFSEFSIFHLLDGKIYSILLEDDIF
jgi:hypothetical protein